MTDTLPTLDRLITSLETILAQKYDRDTKLGQQSKRAFLAWIEAESAYRDALELRSKLTSDHVDNFPPPVQ